MGTRAEGPAADVSSRALSQHRAGRLPEAESLYRAVLRQTPSDPNALHMLGVVRLARGDAREARALMLRALDLTDWRVADMRTNLGLVLSAMLHDRWAEASWPLRESYAAMLGARRANREVTTPLVSVVMPSFNHARFVERALRSVFEQTYRNVELIVIDDGSTDDSVAVIERVLLDSPVPTQFVPRANCGAPATLNEGLARARGEFVQFLNSDDALVATRLAWMVGEVACTGAAWGFTDIAVIDAEGRPIDAAAHPRAAALQDSILAIPAQDTVGLALLAANAAVSSGNLFVARPLAEDLGGFGDFRYNHDWDFCLRALERSEPVFVSQPLYRYRLHATNTIAESSQGARLGGARHRRPLPCASDVAGAAPQTRSRPRSPNMEQRSLPPCSPPAWRRCSTPMSCARSRVTQKSLELADTPAGE